MCSEMSQYMPTSATCSAIVATAVGSADQPGSPDTRSASAAALLSRRPCPLRYPRITHQTASEAHVAPRLAIATWSRAAPPAGFGPAAASIVCKAEEIMTSINVTLEYDP